MTQPNWNVLRNSWAEDDGALLDIYVSNTSGDDWREVIEAVSSRWPTAYAEDGDRVQMPDEPRDVFACARTRTCRFQLALTPLINAKAYFFAPDEIEFDSDPRELLDQADLDTLVAFISTIGQTLQRPVYVGIEGGDPRLRRTCVTTRTQTA
jgi:hypothetical protein